MKPVISSLLLTVILLISSNCIAQKTTSPRPFLFSNYPAVINCTETELSSLFNASEKEIIHLPLQGGLLLNGPVIRKATKYESLETVSIQLPEFHNIIFSISKRINANNKVVYIGHLVNPGYADGYELRLNKDNHYQFTKIITDHLLPACNQ